MARPSVVPEIVALLEPYLDRCMAEWDAGADLSRAPTLPVTADNKVNVRALTLALGLRQSQEQHFFNHPDLALLVNVVAEAQGVRPIGSRAQVDADDAVVRKRLNRMWQDESQLLRTLAEREAVIEAQRAELRELREQLGVRDETGMVLRTRVPS